MERHFDTELKELKGSIVRLGELVEEEIRRSIESLKALDGTLARNVIESDRRIDELELAIDEKCIDLLALHQPLAKDLRFITTALKINAELERIADIAVDIAERTLDLVGQPLLKPLIDIPKLTATAQSMVAMAIEAFIKGDVDLAKKVLQSDAEANRLRDAIQVELVNDYLVKDGRTAPRAVPLLLVARFLERICDHATNIAENVIYMVQAEVVRHRGEKPKGDRQPGKD